MITHEIADQRDRTKQRASAKAYLVEKANEIGNHELRNWCLEIINSPDFQTCTAAKRKHQAYEGGLLVHTAEVLKMVEGMAGTPCLQLDMDVVTTAVIFHDIGKLYDYTTNPDGTYEYNDHHRLVRHLPRSYAIFMARYNSTVSNETTLHIGHCILAHHGRKEWGSPVEPQTPEAYAIHCADWMSSHSTVDYWE